MATPVVGPLLSTSLLYETDQSNGVAAPYSLKRTCTYVRANRHSSRHPVMRHKNYSSDGIVMSTCLLLALCFCGEGCSHHVDGLTTQTSIALSFVLYQQARSPPLSHI